MIGALRWLRQHAPDHDDHFAQQRFIRPKERAAVVVDALQDYLAQTLRAYACTLCHAGCLSIDVRERFGITRPVEKSFALKRTFEPWPPPVCVPQRPDRGPIPKAFQRGDKPKLLIYNG